MPEIRLSARDKTVISKKGDSTHEQGKKKDCREMALKNVFTIVTMKCQSNKSLKKVRIGINMKFAEKKSREMQGKKKIELDTYRE